VQSIPATWEVVIRAGDAGALWVSLWGGAAEPLGPDGRVVTRSFPLGSPQGAPAGTGSRGPDGPTVADPTARSLVGVTGPTVDSAPSRQTMPSATTNANAGGTPTAPGRTVQPPAGTPASRTLNAPAPARDQVPPEALIVSAAEGWFESYYRRLPYDAFGTSHRPSVADGRQPDSRLPEGIWEVNRTFDDVQVQVVADTAIYSARMTEHGRAGEVSAAHASRVSQVWVRRGTGWQLMDVKLLSEPRP
jgi:hypothetical protein